MDNYKSKNATARKKVKRYVAALSTIKAESDMDSVASVDLWGSDIDNPPPPRKRLKRIREVRLLKITQRSVEQTLTPTLTLEMILIHF